MAVIHHRTTVARPRDVAFGFVNDHRHVPEWMFGVTRFEPTTEKTDGLGAIYDAAMTIGPKSLTSTLEVTEWIENELIVLTSIDGFDAGTRWHFTDSDDATLAEVEFRYRLPGGLAGKALGLIIEPVVGQAIRHTDTTLRQRIEELP